MKQTPKQTPIVGIGASAGGLEAFKAVLEHLPSDTGFAFVFIQHLDPTHSSYLKEALTQATQMPVHEITDGTIVERNHIYVNPPNQDLGMARGRLKLYPRARKRHLPIDKFFKDLGKSMGSKAIGIILSGNASDGTLGLRAIQAAGGITLVQDPMTAKCDGMPRSAISGGVVNFVLSPKGLSSKIVQLAHSPRAANKTGTLKEVLDFMREKTGKDFSEYKTPTVSRRLARRLAHHKVRTLKQYLKILQTNPDEVHALAKELLIHVTSFFRDPKVFEKLKAVVLPEVMKQKPPGGVLRVWVAGCSTGEEVYTVAISILEFLGNRHWKTPIQIFGSDISETMIQKARNGFYSNEAVLGLNAERLRNFFTKVTGGYRILKSVRDLCIFVRHDLVQDPPLSRMDLVTCRNTLIYFNAVLQKKVISTFHYCLQNTGFLLLGRTESVFGAKEFRLLDKILKLYARTGDPGRLGFQPAPRRPIVSHFGVRVENQPEPLSPFSRYLDTYFTSRYSPAGVVVNSGAEIVYFRGDVGQFFEEPACELGGGLFQTVRKEFRPKLLTLFKRVKQNGISARHGGVSFGKSIQRRMCNLVVLPASEVLQTKELLYLVLFELHETSQGGRSKLQKNVGNIDELQEELSATRSSLDQMRTRHQRATEEHLSNNEELQSLNEELETAKEELQSTNEELTTVNDELRTRNQEVILINEDLVTFLDVVEMPILILDANRRIRRFTPKARKILNLLPADIGRSIDDISLNIPVERLDRRIDEVLSAGTLRELEIKDHEGRWQRLQIRPFKTSEGKIAGVVLSLVDVDKLKRAITVAEKGTSVANEANEAKDIFLATLSHELRTPLTSLLLQAQLLSRVARQDSNCDPRILRAAEAIEKATNHQARLVDDLLDVSRIITGKLSLEMKDIKLSSLLRTAVEAALPSASQRSTKIETFIDDSIGTFLGDATRLKQVVWNLLSNAIKFSPEFSKITMTLKKRGDQAVLQVKDQGNGIESEFLPFVFERFFQAKTSLSQPQGGLGLGLSITRYLVEQHGGSICAESPGLNRGATFTVTLPMQQKR